MLVVVEVLAVAALGGVALLALVEGSMLLIFSMLTRSSVLYVCFLLVSLLVKVCWLDL